MHQTFEKSSLAMTYKLDDMIELPKSQSKKTYKEELKCEIVMVKIPKCMSWLDACDEPIGDLDMIQDKVDNPSPQSTLQVLLSFKDEGSKTVDHSYTTFTPRDILPSKNKVCYLCEVNQKQSQPSIFICASLISSWSLDELWEMEDCQGGKVGGIRVLVERGKGYYPLGNMGLAGSFLMEKERDAVIVCGKKEVRVPYKDKTLVVKGNSEKEPSKKQLQDVPVIRNYPEVFPDNLPGLPPPRQVEFRIELVPGAAPVARAPYRLAPSELKELSDQLKECRLV
ncbi:hypothetical protein Tco_0888906 [Tanacetum coccineum]